ncbi:MAG: hypothetical protein WAJ94_08295 [Candidatus Cybelea sp.]
MGSPLARYVTLTYAKYFVLLLVPFALVALPVALDFRNAYLMILPLAVVDVAAFAGSLRSLSSRGELETLQGYGVPERSVGGPLALATCAPLAAFLAAAIPLSGNPESALLFGAIGLLVTIYVPLAVVRRCWSRR